MAEYRFEPSPRWIRTLFGGVTVADSKRVMLLKDPDHTPVYYFPAADVRRDLLQPSGQPAESRWMGAGEFLTLSAGGRIAENAAWRYASADLRDYIGFDWNTMDAWYEEDDQIFVHARDPLKRVDVLRSSRQVQVILGGEMIADTHRPSLLFETHLPTRYYIPRGDIRMDMLTPSDTHTRCPYKGVASYWSATIGGQTYKDIVWTYEVPIPECPKIEQLMCFFNERVEAIYVDGEHEQKPVTKWS